MFAFRTINMFSQAVVSCTDALASFPQPSFLKNRKEIDVKKILASFLKPSTFLKKCSLLLCFSVLIGCGEDGAVSVSAKHTAATQEKESGESVCLEIPQALTQGTGNLAIFNSLGQDVLLSYSSNLNTDDVIAVIGAKQKGVKVDVSKRTSSIVTVFAFKMPAVQDYFKADCEDSQMPTAFMQSGFIPSAKSSFVIGTEESKSDYGILLVRNNRDEKVSIFQGSSQNQQIGVIASKELNYRIKIPVGARLLMFYPHTDAGEIDFQNPVLVKNLVFNKDDKKRVIIPEQQVLSVAKINFLNSSDQDVMLTVRNSDEALFNVECSCPDLNKDDSNFKMILVNGRHYPNGNANDFFFSVVSLDTGQTLIRSKPFKLDKNTNVKFTLNKNLTLTKDLVNAVVAKNQEPEKPEDLKISQVTSNSLQFSWSPSADADGQVTGYEVSHKTGNGNWQVGTDTTQTNVIVSGLQAETSYTFRVRAKDDENAWSDYEESKPVQTLEAANQPPSKPSTISTSQVTGSSIKVSWSAATDSDGVIVANYEISYKAGDGFWTGTSMTASTTYTFQSLQPNTSYTFRVRAKDDEGDWSAYQQSTAVSTAPNAPTALAVSARSLTFMMTSGSSYECSKDAGTTKTNCNSPFSFGDDAIAELDPQSHFYPKISLVFFCTCARLQENVERGMCTNIFCFFKFLIQNNTMNMKFFIYSFLIVLVFGGCNWDNLNTSETSGFSKFSEEENEVSQAGTWNFDNGNKPNGLTGNWSVVSGGANNTSKSLKSANIGNNQQTCVQTTRNVSAGNVEFQYKVSSEQNYDELFFYIDSAEKLGGKSGNIGWTQASYAVSAGSHTFKWCYQKDDHVSGGSDAAWIDEVNFPDSYAANKPPEKPSNISTSDVTADSIKVSWTAATDSDGSISGYEVSYKIGNGFWSGTSTTANTTYTFQSLQPATSYTFRVRAKDDDGDWSAYQQSSAVNTLPSAPTSLAVSGRSLTFNKTSGNSYECSKNGGTSPSSCTSPFAFGDDAIASGKLCVRVKASGNTPASNWTCYDQAISAKANSSGQVTTWNFDNGYKPNGLSGNWSVVMGGANNTFKSLKSSSISDDQETCVQTTQTVSAGQIKFHYKVSSEQNWDWLRFYIDSSQKLYKSGTIGWTQASFDVSAGSHTFKWCYEKDSSSSEGSDATWIDEVQFPTTSSSNSQAIYSQDFESVSVNTRPAGYAIIYSGLGSSHQRVEESAGNRYFRVVGRQSWVAAIRKDFSTDFPQKTTVSAKMKFVSAGSNGYLGGIELKNQAEEAGHIGITRQSNGQIEVVCKGGEKGQVASGQWFHLKMEFDFSTKKVKKYVNNQYLCEDDTDKVDLNYQWNSWGQDAGIRFDSFNHSTIVNHFDDVLISQSSNPSVDVSKYTWKQIKANNNQGWSDRWGHTSVVFNNKIWVMEGWHNKNDVWNSSDGVSWQRVSSSTGRSNLHLGTSVVFKNKIWLLGGDTGGHSGRNFVWNSSDGQIWTKYSANWGRSRHTSVVFKNKIWVLGGMKNHNKFNDVWSSSDGQTWTRETNSAGWSKRLAHTSVVFKNKIWVLGGDDGGFKNDVWSSSDGKNWTRETNSAGWSARDRHSSIVFDGKIWVLGGYGSGHKNDVWSSSDGVNWTKVTASAGWSARLSHANVVFKDKIWVLGGADSSSGSFSNYQNDVWAFGP